ncbi:unnamed protein product [Prorocentrum cordatum]|uniref:Secreted protein n=1 Tax=Prorocentrum cordatum TaxID=2364126 RepID=A0ABN9XZ19_9DINO|nr:unnamed protein product [Polarella glacialis]
MAAWIRSCSLLRLLEAAGNVATAAHARSIAPCLLDTSPMDEAERKTWQRQAVAILWFLSNPALAHARSKLGRWSIASFPRLRPDRLCAVGRLLSARAFSGRCAARRFQGRAGRALGCNRGEDSIEHDVFLRAVPFLLFPPRWPGAPGAGGPAGLLFESRPPPTPSPRGGY